LSSSSRSGATGTSAGGPGTRYEPVNHLARSTALQRAEQKGNASFSSFGFTRARQLGQRCIACLLKCGVVGFNKRDSGQPQVGRLTAWRYHFMTAAMAAERKRERIVLVVDDDPDILQTLALCLSTEGYGVLMASNGQEALDVLRQQKPACILLDLMMPVMDGWQFVTELEQRGWRKAPLLILSADRAVQGHATRLHAEAYLAKPFDLDELLGKVSALTGGPDGHGQAAKSV
jgi:CheY-like chemotaxis protein